MHQQLNKRARWADEAIRPANSVVHQAGRTLVDLPIDVTPGARQVAQLTAWRAAQDYAIAPVAAALDELSKLSDWSGGFLVADTIDFDWRTAPFKHYKSFQDFYHKELEAIWVRWAKLQETWRLAVEDTTVDQSAQEEGKGKERDTQMPLADLKRIRTLGSLEEIHAALDQIIAQSSE